jgi:hypothetical protein
MTHRKTEIHARTTGLSSQFMYVCHQKQANCALNGEECIWQAYCEKQEE